VSSPDTGTPTERTELAWQRTALSLVAGSAVITRLTFGRLGTLALTSLVVALPLSLWVLLESRLRYRRGAGTGRPVRSGDGVPAAALALGTVAVAAVELAALLRPR
jgi:uncharacterized membrane protein YidH (DUF202 family)